LRVWIEPDFHDGINWRQTSKPMLKVRLRYDCLPPHQEIKFRNTDEVTAASAVYDDRDRKYKGKPWSYAPSYFFTVLAGYPFETTIYFEAPEPGFGDLDLDYAAEFLDPGQMFRFRIP